MLHRTFDWVFMSGKWVRGREGMRTSSACDITLPFFQSVFASISGMRLLPETRFAHICHLRERNHCNG